MTGVLLAVKNLSKRYFGVVAVDDVSFELEAGKITGLIGPNGSGKSTLFDCVTAINRANSGSVVFEDRPISGLAAHAIARRGLSRTFQNLHIFPQLTVEHNLRTASQAKSGFSFVREIAGGRAIRLDEARAIARAIKLMDQVDLLAHRSKLAGELSYGQQKLLVLSMAMMTEPKLVLFDEPVAGVNPALIERIKTHIREWNGQGASFCIIEHNLRLVMDLCDTVLVLDRGRLLMQDTPENVANDDRVIEAYLGRRRQT